MKNNYKKGPILIDCTLRDGGYYNKWDFESSLIKVFIRSRIPGINFVELGFRTLKNDNYLGPLAYCTKLFFLNLNF